jgi:hypothetical protein
MMRIFRHIHRLNGLKTRTIWNSKHHRIQTRKDVLLLIEFKLNLTILISTHSSLWSIWIWYMIYDMRHPKMPCTDKSVVQYTLLCRYEIGEETLFGTDLLVIFVYIEVKLNQLLPKTSNVIHQTQSDNHHKLLYHMQCMSSLFRIKL